MLFASPERRPVNEQVGLARLCGFILRVQMILPILLRRDENIVETLKIDWIQQGISHPLEINERTAKTERGEKYPTDWIQQSWVSDEEA